MKKVLIFILLGTFFINISPTKALDTLNLDAESAILIDNKTGKVLYEKNSTTKLPMASMTKIMSMLLIMEQISNGNLNFKDTVLISKNASSMGGSQVFLQAGETYKVEDLLKCIAVSSANDAVVAMAEKISGSETAFVDAMNAKAKELNLINTHFANPHGLDNENHYSTASDMAKIAQELLKHEEILRFTSIYEDYLTKPDGSQIWLVNTNRLVRFYDGVDGLKTGYTPEAGYCLTATAKKNNMRLISVVMKSSSADARSKDTATLLTYGFNSYKNNIIFSKDKALGKLNITNGKKEKVSVYLKNDASVLLKTTEKIENYSFNIKGNEIIAPLKANSKVGTAEIIDNEGNIIGEEDIIIKEDLKKAEFFDYFKHNLKLITSGK